MAWSDIAAAIQQQAQASGLNSAETLIAEVIAYFETGGGASLYNPWDVNGPSVGIFQFHTGGPGNPGQLDGFAKWLGLPMFNSDGTVNQAVVQQAMNPTADAQYALRQGGYLYNSIVQGFNQGLSGAALAIYVEIHGQGAQVDSIVQIDLTNIFNKLNSQPGAAPPPIYSPSGPPPPPAGPTPPGATNIGGPYIIQTPIGPIDLTPILQPLLGTFGTGLNDAIGLVNWLDQPAIYERIALVVIGGVLAIVGTIFFGLSFIPKGVAKAVPVVGGELSKVAGT